MTVSHFQFVPNFPSKHKTLTSRATTTVPKSKARSPMSSLSQPILLCLLLFCFSSFTSSTPARHGSCPLEFRQFRKMLRAGSYNLEFLDVFTECRYLLEGFRLIRSENLRRTGNFSVPPNAAESCWESFQILVAERLGPFDVRSNCWIQTSWISNSCFNIATRSDFETLVPATQLQKLQSSCNQQLGNGSACNSCTASSLAIEATYFRRPENGSLSDCLGFQYIYAAAFANRFGPMDLGTAKCLFALDLNSYPRRKHKVVVDGILKASAQGFSLAVVVVWLLCWWLRRRRKKTATLSKTGTSFGLDFGCNLSENRDTTLIKFTYEEMKAATGNFSTGNLIGRGGYGNVYRGILSNGCEVALKRFKNCSASGDACFTHEVEVIASVKHTNLINLRDYCTSADPLRGHQRIIVCDFMRNGSLHDHLFRPGATNAKLSWPIRRKIALGTARGLAYLHKGAQPAIVHRDVKASNILLDDTFEPKLADFGLAKFTPDGLSHLSTRVAGTLGYVAPEYALFGQLTERSDVYSFGVVLLELLSGKQAVGAFENGQPLLLAEWAWSLVRKGQALDVTEKGMPEMAPPEVMEKYVMTAVVSAHPLLPASPTMEQIVNILETHEHTMV